MKIRDDWISEDVRYPNKHIINDAKRRFNIQKESLEGREAKVDGVSTTIVVQAHTNVLYQSKYDYKVHCDTNVAIGTGSILKFDNKNWMIVTKIYDNRAYKTASVLQCSNSIVVDGNIVPVCVESQTRLYALGIWNDKFFSTPESEVVIMIPDNDTTKAIRRNDVFRLTSDNYVVVDLNKIIMPGIIVAKLNWCIEDAIVDSDSTIPEIDNGYVILGQDEIKFGQTAIYTVRKYVAGQEVSATFTFSIIGQDNAYGLTTVSENQCAIKCNDYSYDVVLRATETEDEFTDKQIKLRPLL